MNLFEIEGIPFDSTLGPQPEKIKPAGDEPAGTEQGEVERHPDYTGDSVSVSSEEKNISEPADDDWFSEAMDDKHGPRLAPQPAADALIPFVPPVYSSVPEIVGNKAGWTSQPEAERLVIGTCLKYYDPTAVDRIIDTLEPEHFADPLCRKVFESLRTMKANGQPIEFFSVLTDLKRRFPAFADEVKFTTFVNTQDWLSLDSSVILLEDAYDRRRIKIQCERLAELAVNAIDVDTLRADAANAISTIVGKKPLKVQPGGWRDPEPMPNPLLPVPRFDIELLPRSLRPWISDIAEQTGAPLDFVAVAALTSCAGLIGRRVGIKPIKFSNWVQPGVIWSLLIGTPGSGKSPALREALKPIHKIESEAAERFASKGSRADKIHAEAKINDLKAKLAKSMRVGTSDEANTEARQIAEQLADAEIEKEKATPARFLVKDTTIEKLADLLKDNPRGMLMERDEIAGLFDSFQREGNQGARQFYLECWSGTGTHNVDRIGRGSSRCEGLCLSMVGGTQPEVLQSRLLSGKGKVSDGFLARFGAAVWPDPPENFKVPDRPADEAAERSARTVYEFISRIDAEEIGATMTEDPKHVPYLRFDDEAQRVFDAWYVELKSAVNENRERCVDSTDLQDHLLKYQSLVPVLALVDHVVSGRHGFVTAPSVVKAVTLIRYFEAHARRMYFAGDSADTIRAITILNKIRTGDLKDRFTPRTVQRNNWGSLNSQEAIRPALEYLTDLGYVRPESDRKSFGQSGGRPAAVYEIHPKLLKRI